MKAADRPQWARKLGQPTAFVLYATPDGWRHATYTSRGVLDGRLSDVDAHATFEEASSALIALTEQWSGATCDVHWRPTEKPGWWTGEITLTSGRADTAVADESEA